MDEMRDQFLHVTQGERTVFAYEQEFLRLSRYAPELVSIEEFRCKRLRQGLKVELQVHVTAGHSGLLQS